MKVKKAGFLTKIVVLILLIAGSICLLKMQGRIASAQSQRDELEQEVVVKEQSVAGLQDAIEHSDDPERQKEVASRELELVEPGTKVIIFTE